MRALILRSLTFKALAAFGTVMKSGLRVIR